MSYQSTVALRQARTMRRNQNAVRFNSDKRSLGPVSNTLILALILVLVGLLYLTQITKTSAYGFDIGELKEQKTELVKENQSLQVEAARLQALERIKRSEVAKNLNNADTVQFVRNQ